MIQSLLRQLPAEPRSRAEPGLPAYQQALLELSLRLLQQAGSDAPLVELLPCLREAMQADGLCLLLPLPSAPGWRRLANLRSNTDTACPMHAGELPVPGGTQLCRGCLAQGRFRAIAGLQVEEGRPALLLVDFPQMPEEWQRERLREISRTLREVLQAFAEDRHLRRCELSAERGMLARELHDSVAQQLSYLQIRASRLQAVYADPHLHATAGPMLDDLRDTLRVMHRQVRELISSARLTMDGRTLREALEASVAEFSRCSSCVFSLDNRLPASCLPAEGELQVLQIVREALANVVRHSHARQVWVRLLQMERGVEVEVRDNGVGLPQQLPDNGHFGLRIMRERAAAIGAELAIEACPEGGTRVYLQWRQA
jgi:two-component system nitrate/nitrite sensor histidine kinase NarX